MITVEMPDGTRVQFPDGTSRETMLSALREKFPAQSNDPAAYTSEQYREAAKKALAAGDVAAAKRLIARGRAAESANKSWGQWGKEQLFGDNDPSTMNAGEKLGTLLNMGGNALRDCR
jgi:hypothetical protein